MTKLESIAELSGEDKEALVNLPSMIKILPAGSDIVRQGQRPTHCCLVLDGVLHRYRLLRNGLRQISSVHVPGDIPDLQGLHLETMDHTLGALVPSRVAFIPHPEIHAVLNRRPGIHTAFWRDVLVAASIYREWLSGLGRRSASEHAAHFVCELYTRLAVVGLAESGRFIFPIAQVDLADILGLSPVHVNRSLQNLRRLRLLDFDRKMIKIPDWNGLRKHADFDPFYLHLRTAHPPSTLSDAQISSR